MNCEVFSMMFVNRFTDQIVYRNLNAVELDHRCWDLTWDIRTRVRLVVETGLYWSEEMVVTEELAIGKFDNIESVLCELGVTTVRREGVGDFVKDLGEVGVRVSWVGE